MDRRERCPLSLTHLAVVQASALWDQCAGPTDRPVSRKESKAGLQPGKTQAIWIIVWLPPAVPGGWYF